MTSCLFYAIFAPQRWTINRAILNSNLISHVFIYCPPWTTFSFLRAPVENCTPCDECIFAWEEIPYSGTIQRAAVWVVLNPSWENTGSDWSKTGQEPYGEWCARIQGADVGCARHRSAQHMLLPNLKCTKHAWDVKSLLHSVSATLHSCWCQGNKEPATYVAVQIWSG